MKLFTYNQYIEFIHKLRLNAVLKLAEEGEEYQLENNKTTYVKDKMIEKLLQDKKEVTKFINQYINPREKIKQEDLIKYNSNYIIKKYKIPKPIYKQKSKETFFVIEHQDTINNKIIYQNLNYCIDIMQEWIRSQKIKGKSGYHPVIVPIIIYTGKTKWKMKNTLEENQIGSYMYEKCKIDFEYNLIDINKISKKVLLKQEGMIRNILLIKKSKNVDELIENLKLIISETKDKEKLKEIENIIEYLLKNQLKEDIKQEILEKIKLKIS